MSFKMLFNLVRRLAFRLLQHFPILVLVVVCGFASGCTYVYRPSWGWRRVLTVSPQDIIQRPMTYCFRTAQGLHVVNDGTASCPEQERLERGTIQLMRMLNTNGLGTDGAFLVVTRDQSWCRGHAARGCTGTKAEFLLTVEDVQWTTDRLSLVRDFDFWPTACHELAHILGESHGSPISDIEQMIWDFYERCAR